MKREIEIAKLCLIAELVKENTEVLSISNRATGAEVLLSAERFYSLFIEKGRDVITCKVNEKYANTDLITNGVRFSSVIILEGEGMD